MNSTDDDCRSEPNLGDVLALLHSISARVDSLAEQVRAVRSWQERRDNERALAALRTSFAALPRELVARILVHIRPDCVVRLRRVSRLFDATVSAPAFVRRCLRLHGYVLPTSPRSPLSAEDAQHGVDGRGALRAGLGDGDAVQGQSESHILSVWFNWPPVWQSVYAQLLLRNRESLILNTVSLHQNTGIPPALPSLLPSLQTLVLYRCNLYGPIPADIGLLKNLTTLRLDDNELTGSIPPSIGNCTKLVYLCLDQNKLSGTIPRELGNCTQLRLLNLKGNRGLLGPVPGELRFLRRLQWLYLGIVSNANSIILERYAAESTFNGGNGSDSGSTSASGDEAEGSAAGTIPAEIAVGSHVWNLLRREGLRPHPNPDAAVSDIEE
ncbi:hypothetical protein HDU83_002310 [Entophlyctis luteolus]|nr:hypothetical protein HDU83_002310 [Entophlyctis luteolus]